MQDGRRHQARPVKHGLEGLGLEGLGVCIRRRIEPVTEVQSTDIDVSGASVGAEQGVLWS